MSPYDVTRPQWVKYMELSYIIVIHHYDIKVNIITQMYQNSQMVMMMVAHKLCKNSNFNLGWDIRGSVLQLQAMN